MAPVTNKAHRKAAGLVCFTLASLVESGVEHALHMMSWHSLDRRNFRDGLTDKEAAAMETLARNLHKQTNGLRILGRRLLSD